MIRSMTAFARREQQEKWGRLVWEIRSVNHRYLEIVTRLPDEFRILEPKIKAEIANKLNRGKIECNLRFMSSSDMGEEVVFNEELAKKVIHASRDIDGLLYNPSPINSMDILKWPGMLIGVEAETDTMREHSISLLSLTLSDLVSMRQGEGEKIKAMIEQRCHGIKDVVDRVRQVIPEIIERRRQRLTSRLEELQVQVDQSRLEQELAMLIQKLDVDEEMDRLDVHLQEVLRLVDSDEPVGRRLDFLMQELNREANTLGSKSVDVDTSRASVDLKVFIEQMREQIQNIE